MTDISPSQDAYTSQGVPDTNYSTNSYLQASIASPNELRAFMTFPIPSGTYTAASLRLRVGSGTNDESADTFRVEECGSFTASTMTWNTGMPSVNSNVLYSGAPFTTADTEVNLTLTTTEINTAAGGDLNVCLYAPSPSDRLLVWSQDHAAPGYRPLLTLTAGTDNATYTLTTTYEVDATASTGTTSLTQTAGTTVGTITESPTGVFTFDDPGGSDSLVFDLDAGSDTEVVTITRTRPPSILTYLGGTVTDLDSWG